MLGIASAKEFHEPDPATLLLTTALLSNTGAPKAEGHVCEEVDGGTLADMDDLAVVFATVVEAAVTAATA